MSTESSETSLPNRRRTRKSRTTTESAVEPVQANPPEQESEASKPVRATRRARVRKPSQDEEFGESLIETHADDVGRESGSGGKPVEESQKPVSSSRRPIKRDEELDLSFDDFDEPQTPSPSTRSSTPLSSDSSSTSRRSDLRSHESRSHESRSSEIRSSENRSGENRSSGYRRAEGGRVEGGRPESSRRGHDRRSDYGASDRPAPVENFDQSDDFAADLPISTEDSRPRPPYEQRRRGGASQPPGRRDRGGQRFRDRNDRRPRPGDNRGVDNRGGDNRGGDNRGGDNRGTDNRGGDNRGGDQSRGDTRGGRYDRPQGDGGFRGQGGGQGQQGGKFKNRKPLNNRSNYTAKSAYQTNTPVPEINGTYSGVLELHPKGYGFIRDPLADYGSQEQDPFVSSSLVEKYRLREGVLIQGHVGAGSRNQGPRLHELHTIDGRTPEEYESIKNFDELTAINPFEQIKLETGPSPLTTRIMDLLTPIGKGQRALIVAPPRTGKTMLLQDIANSVSVNHPECHLIVLLIDERPEEVTEMRRLVRGEVIASSMDRDVESHVRTSQLIIERGKRIAEAGGDAFILLDSITRTARAFNKWVGNTGRTMTGGLDVKAMDIPKKMFGQARRFDEGGSLTIVGTSLIQTGSQMDEVIFQEFKGTGNMEMVLSRDLADRRIWPAIDVTKSGTRREEKILDRETLEGVTLLRRSLVSMNPVEAMEQLTATLSRFPTNKEFLQKIKAIL